MKHWLLHIIYIGAMLLLLPACSQDEEIIDTPEQTVPESRAGITARIAVPDPITADGENITINTVRLFVFDTDGTCLAKSDKITVTKANIEKAEYESDHEQQYVVTIETGLTLPKPTSIRSYEVYAVINEQMGGTEGNSNYLGITTPADWSTDFANVTNKASLEAILAEPLGFTFDANNALPEGAFKEPQFILCGSAAWAYNPKKPIKDQPVIINAKGIDRPMAKVTIESISSGDGKPTIEASQLFVTGVEFVNMPNEVFIDVHKKATTFLDDANLNNSIYFDPQTNSFDRGEWNGNFNVDLICSATLRQTTYGMFWQTGKITGGAGIKDYTCFPPEYKGEILNFEGNDRRPATFFPTLEDANRETVNINGGNYLGFLKVLSGEQVGGSTKPSIVDFNCETLVTVTPAPWSFKLGSYYIPENCSDIPTKLRLKVAIGKPIIKTPADDDPIVIAIRDKILADWVPSQENEWKPLNPDAEHLFVRTEWNTEENPNGYVYIDKSGQYYIDKSVEGVEYQNYFNGSEFEVSSQSPTVTFEIPISKTEKNYVNRNHEYIVKIVANNGTYDAILNYSKNSLASRAVTAEELGLTVIREVKPLK